MKKLLAIGLALSIGASVLAACQSQSTKSTNPKSETTGAVERTQASENNTTKEQSSTTDSQKASDVAEKHKIEFWYDVEEQYRWQLEELAQEFEAEFPQYQLELIYSGDDKREKMIAANLAGGEDLPALINHDSGDVYELGSTGMMTPLNDYMAASETDFSDFSKGMVETFSWEGNTYWLPFLNSAVVWYYNKDAAKAEGIKMPEHWDEMDDFLTKATKEGRRAMAFAGWNLYYLDTVFTNNGVQFVKEDGTTDVVEGPALEMSKQFKDWYDQGKNLLGIW